MTKDGSSKTPPRDVNVLPLLLALVLACTVTVTLDNRQPTPVAAELHPWQFSGTMAVNWARVLTAHGPRPTGSPAETLAFQARACLYGFQAAPSLRL
jgi:hypothetical protein